MNASSFKRTDQAIFAEVGSDIVALNVERGSSYGLEEVTATVWQLLSEPLTIAQLCEKLTDVYEVDPATCRADVEGLIADFVTEGLVERCGSGS